MHGVFVRLWKTEFHCFQTDASKLLLSVFSSPLAADIFSQMQFIHFRLTSKKKKKFWKQEESKRKL